MNAEQLQVGRGGGASGRLPENRQRHAELAVGAADEADPLELRVVRDGQAEQDRLAAAQPRGDPVQAPQLAGRLDRDGADAGGDGRGQLRRRACRVRSWRSRRGRSRPAGRSPARRRRRCRRRCRSRAMWATTPSAGLALTANASRKPNGRTAPQGVDAAADQVQVVDVERRAEVRGQGLGEMPASRPGQSPSDRERLRLDRRLAAGSTAAARRRCRPPPVRAAGSAALAPPSRSSQRLLERDPRVGALVAVLDDDRGRKREPVGLARTRPRPGGRPGATTAPAGTTSGSSSVPTMTRPCTRSYRRLVPVRMTPAAMTAPRLTSTPSSSAAWAPTKTSSSTMTGRRPAAPARRRSGPPAERWTRDPIWAHEPTRTCESTIVPSPTQAPTLMYEGGMIVTPGREVDAAADRGSARDDAPGLAGGQGRARLRRVEEVLDRQPDAVAELERAVEVPGSVSRDWRTAPGSPAGRRRRRASRRERPGRVGRPGFGRRRGRRDVGARSRSRRHDRADRRPVGSLTRGPSRWRARGPGARRVLGPRGPRASCRPSRPPSDDPARARRSSRGSVCSRARCGSSSGSSGIRSMSVQRPIIDMRRLDRHRVRAADEVGLHQRQPALVDRARLLPVAGERGVAHLGHLGRGSRWRRCR